MSNFIYQEGTYTKVREKLHELLLTVGYTEEIAHLWLGGDCTEDMFKAEGFTNSDGKWINRKLCTPEDIKQGIPCTVRFSLRDVDDDDVNEIEFVGMYFGLYLKNVTIRDTRYDGLPTSIIYRDGYNKTLHVWWIVNDESHNMNGPASLKWVCSDNSWNLVEVEYDINSETLKREEFVQMYEMTHLEEYKGI